MTPTIRENSATTTGHETCSFLRLPVEVRDMIYHYHLTSSKILPRHRSATKRWTPIDLLYVSRTIYSEAFVHLYTKGEFVLTVRPGSIFGFATCWGTKRASATVGPEHFTKSEKILRLIKHIALDIWWPSYHYSMYFMSSRTYSDTLTPCTMLKQTMNTLGAMLSRLPALRTIDISWSEMKPTGRDSEESGPPGYKIPVWLRGLKQVRRRNEKVLIRMPLEGPVSTERLSRDQEDQGELDNLLKEFDEDCKELLGFLGER